MKKLTTKQTLAKVQDFVKRMKVAHTYHGEADFQTIAKKMDAVMSEIDAFDRSLGPGLKVGRLVSWPQGDGYAFYFVTRVGKQVVQLAHLPWWDNWHSPVVVDGQALRQAVERAIKAREGLREIFGTTPGKPIPPNK